MKIAMVSEHASPLATVGGTDAGGQNVHVAALSLALAAQGHEVAVYTRRESPFQQDEVVFAPGVTVVHVPAGPAMVLAKDDLLPWMPDFSRWLATRWTATPPDIAHSHFWMSGLAALAAARDTAVPVAHTFHALGTVKRRHQGTADTSPRERVEIETFLARHVDVVVATCTDEVAELDRMRVSRNRTAIVPCGVDVRAFTPVGPREELGPGPVLLSIGRPVPRKGVETVIRALRHVPDATLVVAGGEPGDPEVNRLSRIAGHHGVVERVRFLGRVGRDSVPALMRAASAVVSVPWYEPFGIVPLEAMACGVPVVASAVGGHLDTVLPGVTGLLVPPRDPEALGCALRHLLADPLLTAAYGAAAAERARSRYGWDGVAAETLAVYADVLSSRAGTRRSRRGRTRAGAA
ncbi:glycosyltransferase involved in cell wall biosynthesis [Streptosporangium becharense]|uniref:Glycosyltransferase involved in cell wall biosynthesis n=1 Tax=Streptosporangium becharense TaxID=1816182 RepID=A0A7W9IIZ4_9ACTN|nr:glycosyltransferase [Streptosporangium becharense]MBB2911329.1 glycosyltransferase involved in cell wall biosynthesis [Streptosporangium becharense]MBB5821613.1 glycosyltransferase involved in cell wall biosynthesis [Streptosporangium becharense]